MFRITRHIGLVSRALFCSAIPFGLSAQGPFAPGADSPGTTAIHKTSPLFISWGESAIIKRGFMDIADTAQGYASVGDENSCLGYPGVNGMVSLGDGGEAIITFADPILNGDGYDFAIFENGFSNDFLELAKVSVSSDGINFVEFNSTSLTPTDAQVDPFGATDPTNLNNLAGKYKVGYGTPFDLQELADSAGIDLQNITHIKITDVVGTIDPLFATYDSQGNIINDPYPTAFASGGFDLDAVGVIHSISKVKSYQKEWSVYPNPASDYLHLNLSEEEINLCLFDLSGKIVFTTVTSGKSTLDLSNFDTGIYLLQLQKGELISTLPVVIKK